MRIHNCLICGSSDVENLPAKFSAFITERVFDNNIVKTNKAVCKNCGFTYSTYRFNELEVLKLYNGYRNEHYQKQRQKHDSWYSKEINELIGKNPLEIKNRIKNLVNILNRNVDNWEKIFQNVVDYGGDKGQFIPEQIKNKYVYDISNVELLEDRIPINSLSEINFYVNFVMCCHVLEHVSCPTEIIQEINSIMCKGSYLYLELPYELGKKSFLSNLYYLFNPYFNLKDLIKHYIKLKRSKHHIFSEHINLFSVKSVTIMLEKFGFEILETSICDIDLKWTKSSIISVLAKKI